MSSAPELQRFTPAANGSAGPWRRTLQVTANEQIGPYTLLTLADPDGVPPAPGQFAMLAAAVGWGGGQDERPYLPRALSYARYSNGCAQFLLEPVGPGTERLCALQPGEAALLLGPLGKPFSITPTAGLSDPEPLHSTASAVTPQPLLVGGGIGIAPLLILNDALSAGAQPVQTKVLLGFRDAPHARAAQLFAAAQIATDDGSVGLHGSALPLLQAAIAEHESENSAASADAGDPPAPLRVCACGPPGMLEAVRALCMQRRLDCELALEAPMACGFGACYGCVQPARDGRYLRTCIDGPVIDAALLAHVNDQGPARP